MNPAICAHFLDFVRQIASRIRSQMAVAQTVEDFFLRTFAGREQIIIGI